MIGMDAATGQRIEGEAHLAQSLADILSTPLGSRVALRDYGSLLFELIDAPINKATAILLRAATAIAIARWEPRITLTQVDVTADAGGQINVSLEGARTDLPAATALTRLSLPLRFQTGASA